MTESESLAMDKWSRMVEELDENRIIGELMISRGLVSSEQVTSALYVQHEKPHLRIGEILMSMGVISIDQLDNILREHLSQQFIGSLLLSNGFISQEQLSYAMAMQETTNRRLGELLLELGYVTEFQLNMLLEKQRMLRKPKLMDDTVSDGKAHKRAKIVATVGPACSSDALITDMIRSGVNLFRLNFSHGAHEDHKANI